MNKENSSFPGLCRAFKFRQSFRGERASISTDVPEERIILSEMVDNRELPLGLLGVGFNHTSGEGQTTLESRDIPGIRKIARNLQKRKYEVEDLDRANSSS